MVNPVGYEAVDVSHIGGFRDEGEEGRHNAYLQVGFGQPKWPPPLLVKNE